MSSWKLLGALALSVLLSSPAQAGNNVEIHKFRLEVGSRALKRASSPIKVGTVTSSRLGPVDILCKGSLDDCQLQPGEGNPDPEKCIGIIAGGVVVVVVIAGDAIFNEGRGAAGAIGMAEDVAEAAEAINDALDDALNPG